MRRIVVIVSKLVVAAFLVEIAIMMVMWYFDIAHNPWIHAFVDACALVVVLSLVGYACAIRPLFRQHDRSEAEFKKRERQFRAVIDNATALVRAKDAEGRYIFVNKQYAHVFGRRVSDFLGKTVHDFLPKDVADQIARQDQEVLRTGQPKESEEDGPYGTYQSITVPLIDDSGAAYGICGISTNVTKHKANETRLRTLSRAVEQATHAIIVTDTNARIEYVNPKFVEITGYSAAETIGQTPRILRSEFTPAATYETLWTTIGAGAVWQGELQNRRKDGSYYWAQGSIAPVRSATGRITHYVAVQENVTERKELERQLHQARKMESLGGLAGGIAHDLNNALVPILGLTQLAIDDLPDGSDIRDNLTIVLTAAQRSRDLVKQVLTFARQEPTERTEVELRGIVRESVAFLRSVLPPMVEVRAEVKGPDLLLMANPTEIEQILLNLGTNAGHAIGMDGGVIEVDLAAVRLTGTEGALFYDLAPGPYAKLTFRDTGRGMDQQTLDRAFDPFFTTKAVGEGTGMGLSVVHGIVRAHGGAIRADSTLGQGTTFEIYLPLRRRRQDEAIPEDRAVEAIMSVSGVDLPRAVA